MKAVNERVQGDSEDLPVYPNHMAVKRLKLEDTSHTSDVLNLH